MEELLIGVERVSTDGIAPFIAVWIMAEQSQDSSLFSILVSTFAKATSAISLCAVFSSVGAVYAIQASNSLSFKATGRLFSILIIIAHT